MTLRPLVSLVLLTYNQERWAGEAAAAALAQTYQPLEVVLSDDCSDDETYAILQRAAKAYRGPHRVVVTRTPRNLGVAAHTSRAAGQAAGELIVLAHGDDVSLPDRVAATAAAFAARTELVAVTTRSPLVDGGGAPVTAFSRQGSLYLEAPAAHREARVARFYRALRPSLLGGATTWRRELFERFGPIAADIPAEDLILSFRAHLSGEVTALEQPGIRYRVHGRNLSLTDGQDPAAWARGHYSEAARLSWLRVQATLYPQMARDLARAAQLGLVDFDAAPHLAWMSKRRKVLALLIAQPERGTAGRTLLAARILALAPGAAAARAALLRVLPERAVRAIRRDRG